MINYNNCVEGWLSHNIGLKLYELAKNSQLPIIEIGSFKGLSTCYLANGSKDGYNVQINSIDPHEGNPEHHVPGFKNTFDQFLSNIEQYGFDDIVKPHVAKSEDVCDKFLSETIGLLFIDGLHTYEGCKSDFDLYWKKVCINGIISFHDASLDGKVGWDGPNKLIQEILKMDMFSDFHQIDDFVYFTRKK